MDFKPLTTKIKKIIHEPKISISGQPQGDLNHRLITIKKHHSCGCYTRLSHPIGGDHQFPESGRSRVGSKQSNARGRNLIF